MLNYMLTALRSYVGFIARRRDRRRRPSLSVLHRRRRRVVRIRPPEGIRP